MEKKRKILQMHIKYISLVKSPANMEKLILKNSDFKSDFQQYVKLEKMDSKKHVVYGIVYSPDAVDHHGDFASAETIRKAAYEFMKNAYTKNVDTFHNFMPDGAYIAENWIVKENDGLFPGKTGAWAVGVKIEDPILWKKCEDGEITGLSMAGTGAAEVIQETETETKQSIIQKFINLFQKEEINMDEKNKKEVRELIKEALPEILKDSLKDGEGSPQKDENSEVEELKKEFAEFKKGIEDANKEVILNKNIKGLSDKIEEIKKVKESGEIDKALDASIALFEKQLESFKGSDEEDTKSNEIAELRKELEGIKKNILDSQQEKDENKGKGSEDWAHEIL